MKSPFLILVTLVFVSSFCCGQKAITQAYNNLAEEKWLPRQSIRTIFQDSKGNMWVGTNAGLYKYNLFATVNYNLSQKTSNRLVNNTINVIQEDAEGNILVGTESGLGALNPLNGNFTVLSSSDETILELKKAADGSIWMLTGGGDIFHISAGSSLKRVKSVAPVVRHSDLSVHGAKATTMFPMEDGNLLVGTSKGLFKLEFQTRQLKATAIKLAVNHLFARNYKTIFVGTDHQGLYAARPASNAINSLIEFSLVPNVSEHITAVLPAGADKVLITSSQQVGFLSEGSKDPVFTPVASNTDIFSEGSLSAAFVDRTGTIWLGSKRGLYKLKRQTLQVAFVPLPGQQALGKNVTDLFFDGSHYLFALNGTENISRINLQSGEKKNIRTPFSSVTKIRQASNGTVVLLAERKMIELPKAALYNDKVMPGYRMLYSNDGFAEINDLREVSPGEWWMTSWNAGLLRVMQQPGRSPLLAFEKAKKVFPSTAHLYSIIPDKQGNVWIATRGDGLLKVGLGDQRVQRFRKENGLPNRLICVKQDSKGNIWVGSRGDGLFLYNPRNNTFQSFDISAGLPSNTICSMEENAAGEWWVSTLNGLAKYKPGELMPFLSFGSEDGINNPEHNFNVSAGDESGGVYFGNGNGLYQVVEKAPVEKTSFPVQWTQFDVLTGSGSAQPKNEEASTALLNHFLQSDEVIRLAHNDNNIRIGFAALDFSSPEKNRYAYRLVGKDTAWQFRMGENISVQYFHLPAGGYTLEVKSATGDGGWTLEPQRLSFIIAPSFWASGGGYALYSFILVAGIIVFVLLRRRWLRLNKKLLDEIQLGQRQNQQMVFYTDLSHEIKNRITLILGPLEQALQGKKVNQSVLHNLYDQGLRLKKLTDQIMNIRKRESGSFLLSASEEDIQAKINSLCQEAEPLTVLKNIRFSVDNLKENIRGWCDAELLEIVVMNLLSNAIKYCKVGGNVTVKTDLQYLSKADIQPLPCEGNYLVCSVSDTGIGIPEEDIRHITAPFYRASNVYPKKEIGGTGVGLDLVARLIQMHHGHLEIRSEIGVYTTVTFYLPVDKQGYALNELKPSLDHAPVVMETPVGSSPAQEVIFPVGQKEVPEEALAGKREWTLLLVDDNTEILDLLITVLETDFTLLTAGNGTEALERLQQNEVHLILSDLDMPGMDGLTLCQRVKENKTWKGIPFLILTGRNSEEQKLVCFKYGVDDFIEKPFSNELLRWRVKSMLRNTAAKARLKTVVMVDAQPDVPQNADDRFIQEIVNLIEKNIDKDFLDVDFLAENLFTSRATFYRRMEQLVGESPSVFIRKYRLKKAALLLEHGHSMNEAATRTGFSSVKYFSKCFQKEYGVTPSQFTDQRSGC